MMTIVPHRYRLKGMFDRPGRRWVFLAALLTSAVGAYPQLRTKQKPNIVFIMSDDHAYQAISAYNSDLIQTPAIDRIAREGALLNKAFVTNSICGPSRAVILTGKYSHMNGFMDNHDRFDGDQQTLPKILQKSGYRTAIVGKWHLNSPPQGFDYWNILPGQGEYYQPNFLKMGKDTVYNGYVTDITTNLALEWLEVNKEKPFFIMIHQKAPHRNQMPPLENLNLFNDRKFDLPATFYDDYKNRAALKVNKIRMADNLDIDQDTKIDCDSCPETRMNQRAYQRGMKRLTPEQRSVWNNAYAQEHQEFDRYRNGKGLVQWQYQRFMEDYLRCVKSVDDNVDRVLKYLDAQGLADNTIVVYTSDQGFYLGEHGLYDKRFMYEESFRTPMMIRYPRAIRAGKKVEQMVLNLDIAPTLLSYVGAVVPADMQGASMKDLLSEKVTDWRKEVYYHYYEKLYGVAAHYGLRTSRYKLIHFYDPVNSWELYDLKADPKEMNNLYQQPKYAGLITELKATLRKKQLAYRDPIDK